MFGFKYSKFLLLLVAFSCVSKKTQTNSSPSAVYFAMLYMNADSIEGNHNIVLTKILEKEGEIKKQNEDLNNPLFSLTAYIYIKNRMVDSITINHPLYKHLEYVNMDNSFISKDTIIKASEFFIRFQTSKIPSEIKFLEIFKGKITKNLTTIKIN